MKFKSALLLLAVLAVLLLTGCGGRVSCSNEDVVATVKEAITENIQDPMMASLVTSTSKIGAIVTEESDTENGNFVCSATFIYQFDGETNERPIEYTVKAVVDEENDFLVEYDTSYFSSLASLAAVGLRSTQGSL